MTITFEELHVIMCKSLTEKQHNADKTPLSEDEIEAILQRIDESNFPDDE